MSSHFSTILSVVCISAISVKSFLHFVLSFVLHICGTCMCMQHRYLIFRQIPHIFVHILHIFKLHTMVKICCQLCAILQRQNPLSSFCVLFCKNFHYKLVTPNSNINCIYLCMYLAVSQHLLLLLPYYIVGGVA